MKNFGKNLRKHREKKKLTQWALATKAGLSGPYIHQLESGIRTNPTMETITALANALGVHVADLM